MSISSRLVILGRVLDLRVEHDETIRKIAWKGAHWLFADASRKRLFITPALKTKAPRGGRFDELAKVYREWSQFDSEQAFTDKVRLGPSQIRGRVRTIGYRSDKWTGRQRDYQHDFNHPPRLTQMGDVYRIAGAGLRITPGGIVG